VFVYNARPAMLKYTIRALLYMILVFGLSGFSAEPSSFLHPYGPIAAAQRHLFLEVIGWMMIVVVPAFVLTPLFAWHYRRKNTGAKYTPQWDFSWLLELLIWGVPMAIVGVLAFLIWTKATALDPYAALPSSKPPLEIQVVGLDWKWLFIYPEQHIATVGMVAFPDDRPLRFSLTSDTVMQSFFIPALGSQIYAMAGMITKLNLIADRPGQLRGENTQFNGMGFQNQKFTASAMTPQNFANWVEGVRSAGRPLDAVTYHRLSQRSTTEAARAELGTDRMPASVIYFSPVGPYFFDDIVNKYRLAPSRRMPGKR
jgi:cytochrome o ubiquinol oxidase subunit II